MRRGRLKSDISQIELENCFFVFRKFFLPHSLAYVYKFKSKDVNLQYTGTGTVTVILHTRIPFVYTVPVP